MDPKHYIYELKNGMKVIMVPRKTSGLVYISLVLKNGLLDEDKHTLSFTHAGEHLFAKYTSKKYPRFEGVKGRLGFLGIENNAFTTKFNTGYWFLGNKKHLQFLMNLLSFSLFEYKFTDDWPKQRNIIAEEVKSRHSHIWNPLYEMVLNTLYPGHRLGVTWREELKCLSRASLSDVLQFNSKKWDPQHAMLLVEGDFEVGIILPEIQKLFDRAKPDIHYDFKASPVVLLHGPKLIRKSIPSSHTSKLIYIFQLPHMSRFDLKLDAILLMMLRYFCTGYYSRLYQLLREKYGLIYGLESEYELSPVPDLLPGYLQITIQVDPAHVDKVRGIVDEELERLKKFIIPRKEMLRLKNNLQFQRSMEILNKKPGKFVEQCATFVDWGHPVQTFTEYYDQLRKVKSSEIQGVAKRVFKKEHMLVAIGEGTSASKEK